MTTSTWRDTPERAQTFWITLLLWIARYGGRPLARLILWPTVLWFWLTAPAARRASQQYLRRVCSHPVRIYHSFKHFHTFASVTLDKVFIFLGQSLHWQVTIHNREVMDELQAQKQGALLLVAHIGSFEVMRVRGTKIRKMDIRILMNRAVGARLNHLIERLNPDLAKAIIDTSGSDTDLILRLKAALDQGALIGLMADRLHHPQERTVLCDFLGTPAYFPAKPWLLAHILKVPIILAIGTYHGGRRYEISFTHLDTIAPPSATPVPRAHRDALIQSQAQAYATFLADKLRANPYNWFNFYDFWAAP